MKDIEQTQIMEQNLQRMIKNQNYFSCFIDSSHVQQQPTNPFQKKMFDKNLRRSTLSCGHYNSISNHNQSSQQADSKLNSSRKSLKQNTYNISQSNGKQKISNLQIQNTHRISLAQSRHSDSNKQQITQIINNFRLELDYLEQKLHKKIDQLNIKHEQNLFSSDKERQAGFMIESLQKIVGFMIQNCVNLEDSVMYGNGQYNRQNNENRQIMKKQVYQIEQPLNENMSFSVDQSRKTYRINGQQMKKKRKIVGLIQKQNINCNDQQQNFPSTYFVGDKIHSLQNRSSTKQQKQNIKLSPHFNQNSLKTTNRTQSKSRNQKNISSNNQYHYHSVKQNTFNSHNTSLPENQHPIKSIYQTVLQERQMRMKMKKKMI